MDDILKIWVTERADELVFKIDPICRDKMVDRLNRKKNTSLRLAGSLSINYDTLTDVNYLKGKDWLFEQVIATLTGATKSQINSTFGFRSIQFINSNSEQTIKTIELLNERRKRIS